MAAQLHCLQLEGNTGDIKADSEVFTEAIPIPVAIPAVIPEAIPIPAEVPATPEDGISLVNPVPLATAIPVATTPPLSNGPDAGEQSIFRNLPIQTPHIQML